MHTQETKVTFTWQSFKVTELKQQWFKSQGASAPGSLFLFSRWGAPQDRQTLPLRDRFLALVFLPSPSPPPPLFLFFSHCHSRASKLKSSWWSGMLRWENIKTGTGRVPTPSSSRLRSEVHGGSGNAQSPWNGYPYNIHKHYPAPTWISITLFWKHNANKTTLSIS